MAQTNPFDPIFNPTQDDSALLPGQQSTSKPAPLPEVKADTSAPRDVPEQEPEAAPARRRASRPDNYTPPAQLVPIFEAAAQKYDVPVNVLMALGHQESRYNPTAIGTPTKWGTAKGMMQYLDGTAKGLGINPFDPEQAIPAAAKQIRERLDHGASIQDAIMEHFAGPDRKLWGQKTAAYGREVMEKVGKIGSMLMGEAHAEPAPEQQAEQEPDVGVSLAPDSPAGKMAKSAIDAGKFSTNLPREAYLSGFLQLNPNAGPEALNMALATYDKDSAARAQAGGDQVQKRFDTLNSPEAMFNARLNKKLEHDRDGIVPALTPMAQTVAPQPAAPAVPPTTSDKLAYVGKSLKAGGYDLLGAAAKLLDAVNPFTLSEGDAAVLFKDDPAKLKEMQDSSAAMILSRFAHHMNENADDAMKEAPKAAQDYYGKKEYATTDSGKAAWASPVKVVSDVVRNLPTMAATAVTVYFTRGAAAMAERQALVEGLTAAEARQAGIQAGMQAASKVGAVSEGGIGYAQQAEGTHAELSKLPDSEIAKSPSYQAYVREGFSPEAARAKVIADTAEQSGRIAGIVDAAVNHYGGEFLGKILTEGGKLIPRIMKGAATEAATETVQSGGEQLGQNFAEQQNVNPNKSLTEGVGESMAQGAVVGAASGGAAAGVGGKGHDGVQPAGQQAPQPAAAPVRVEPTLGEPAPAPAPQPAAPSGPLSAALDTAAEQHTPDQDRVTITAPTGEQASGKMTGYQEDEHGNFVAQIMGDDGQVHTLTSQDGVKIEAEAAPDSGPMSAALTAAADEHAENPAPAPAPTPVRPAAPAEPDYNAMPIDELRERLKYIASQAKASGGWNKMFIDARKQVEKAIKAKTAEAMDASKPSEEPLVAGPHEDRGAANKMMSRFVEKTGAPHEVVEADGKFKVQRIKEQSDANPGIDTAGDGVRDGGVQSAQAAAPAGTDQPGGRADDQVAGGSRPAPAGAAVAAAGPAVPGASAAGDGQPALKGGEPPLAKGMTRLYHGSATHGRYDGKAWFSTSRDYAANYRAGGELQYVDVPTERVNKMADPDGYGQTPDKGFTFNAEFDSSDVGMRKSLTQPAAAVDPKREKALKRVEKGTAFFGTEATAQKFIDEHGIADTHQVQQTGARRFSVLAKGTDPAEAPKLSRLEAGRERNRRQDEAVQQAAENIAKRKAEKEAAAKAAPVPVPAEIQRHEVDVIKRKGSNRADEEKTLAALPPVPEGHTRLFRAESPTTKFAHVFKPDELSKYKTDLPGQRYTPDLKHADYYRDAYGKEAKIHYVDVPNAVAEKGRLDDLEYVIDAGGAPKAEAQQPAAVAEAPAPTQEPPAKPKREPRRKKEAAATEKQAPASKEQANEPAYSVAAEDDRDLVITHNLTASNLLHAARMGGIAVPSLAVTKKDSPLTNFGEITLIGSKAMADPKGYAKTQVYGADIYSPRYPSVEHHIPPTMRKVVAARLADGQTKTGSAIDWDQVQRDGARELERTPAVLYEFLKANGIEPSVEMEESALTPERVARLTEQGLGEYLTNANQYAMEDDVRFVELAAQAQISDYERAGKDTHFKSMIEKLRTDDVTRNRHARDMAHQIADHAKKTGRAAQIDARATKYAMEEQVRSADLSGKLERHAQEVLRSFKADEKIFKGFTASGNRAYIPHTLENVVKILKKELRGGENFNYGVGSLRAKFTPQFKSVADIRKNKDRLVSKEQFEKIKKEIDDEFFAVGNAMGVDLPTNTVIAILEDAPKMGLERSAKQFQVELSDDAKAKSAAFLTRLHHLPTEYFEAKILRDVDLSEFSGAVIPRSAPQEVRDLLAKHGVPVREYESDDDRASAIDHFSQHLDTAKGDILFSVGEDAAAIRQVLADRAGEATITRPGIGAISIPYGDEKEGLAHIAARRGQAFADRLPDLLANGEVYTKPGQDDRIFIGNERDEAVIRTSRDGKPSNWLLSAYEKHPEGRQSSVPEKEQPYVRLSDAEIKDAVTVGPLGSVIRAMIDHGLIVIHRSAKTLPKEVKVRTGVQAVTMPDGKIHLVAGALRKDNARAVLLHEMFHSDVKPMLGEKGWGELMGRMGSIYRQGEQSSGKAREFFDRARERVATAKAKGAVTTRMEVEEFAAYAIEEWERAPDSLPAAIRKWVEDFIGFVKACISRKYGRQIGQITPAQLAGFAKMAVLDVAVPHRGAMFGPIGELFSASNDPTVEVDGQRRTIKNSKGQNIAPEFKGQVAFWKWFSSSAAVDEQGRPLVLYHGTSDDFDQFDRAEGGKNIETPSSKKGLFFSNRPDLAAGYATRRRDGAPNVMPVYLALKNPFRADVTNMMDADKLMAGGLPGDGAIINVTTRLGGKSTVYMVKDPSQVKSATGNNGDFDPANPDVRYSVGAAPTTQGAAGNAPGPSQPGLTPPEQGLLRRVQSQLQDNMNRVKQVQDRIGELTGRTNLGRADYYGAETNRPGRIAARLEDAHDQMLEPLMQKIAKAGKTPEQLGELLHAMHAHERNQAVAKINPDMPDGGSGMTDAQANAIIAQYKGDTALHALADDARAIARATIEMKHAYGLITDEHYKTLSDRYEHYVPLKGDGEYGPKVKRAMGHEEREEHILENIARDYDQAVVVGEKNLARQSLLRMALQFPDPELWTVGAPPKGRYVAGKVYDVMKGTQKVATFDSQGEVRGFLEAQGPQAVNFHVVDSAGERVAEFTKPLQDNEVMVYIKGDAVRIQIHDETLARQIRPLDAARMHPILEFMRGTNRYLSKIYTGYNPAFILRNATRDAMTGSINMLGNHGAAVAAKAWAKYPMAAKTMGQWAATKKVPAGKYGAYLTEYRQQGGKVGASYMSDLEQQGETLQFMFDRERGVMATARDGGFKRTGAVAWDKTVGRLAHVVEVANQATENALRLSLFIALREEGASAAKAAQAAKQVTVDFDRKGSSTGALGAIYLFLNPAIQGTANAMRTLATGEHKAQAWAGLGALALLGVYAASSGMGDDRDRWLGEEWDSRTKSLLLNIGGHQLRVPMSQEFAPAYAFGVALAEAGHGESKMKSAAHLVSSFIDAYFPLQGIYRPESDNHLADVEQAVTPTMLKPLTNTALNRNAFGSQIVPENELTKDRPDNLKMFRGSKNSAYDKAAQGIASLGEMMGAGKYENDITKVSPETLKEYWRTYTGGLGQFITDTIGLTGMLVSEPGQVESGDWPIVKDFVRTQNVRPVRSRYFDLSRDAHAAITEFQQAKKAGDGDAMEKIMGDPEKVRLVGLGKMVKSISKAAAALGDEKVDVNSDSKLSGSEKRAKLKEIEAEEEKLYRGGLEAFK